MQLNFWESFALQTGINALQVLAGQSQKLNPQQRADVQRGLSDLSQIQADFTRGADASFAGDPNSLPVHPGTDTPAAAKVVEG